MNRRQQGHSGRKPSRRAKEPQLFKKNDLLYGFHPVCEALRAGRRDIHKLYISQSRKPSRASRLQNLAEEKNIPVETMAVETLDKMTRSANHQGIALAAGSLPLPKAGDVIPMINARSDPSFILVLEGIEDPNNMGALIRTALCHGVDDILVPKDRCAGLSPAVSKSSAGAMEHASIFSITNTASILKSLKDSGIWVFGLDADSETMLFDADLTGGIALVIGGEHKGIRPGVKKECDFLLSIPNKGRINSLNASVAGGIAMYEALRQRG